MWLKTDKEKYIHLHLSGRLDAEGAEEAMSAFKEMISEEDAVAKSILMDFSAVPFVSSAGMRFLLMVSKELQKSRKLLVITAASEAIVRSLDIAGFRKFLLIEPDEKSAIGKINSLESKPNILA